MSSSAAQNSRENNAARSSRKRKVNVADSNAAQRKKKLFLMTNFVEKPQKYCITMDDVETGMLPLSLAKMYHYIGSEMTDPKLVSGHVDYDKGKESPKAMSKAIRKMFKRLQRTQEIIEEHLETNSSIDECIHELQHEKDLVNLVASSEVEDPDERTMYDVITRGFFEMQLHETVEDSGSKVSVFIGFHKNCTHFVSTFPNGVVFKMRFFNRTPGVDCQTVLYPDLISAIHPQALFKHSTIDMDIQNRSIYECLGAVDSVFKSLRKARLPEFEDLVVPAEDLDDDDDDDEMQDFIEDDDEYAPSEDSGEDHDHVIDSDDEFVCETDDDDMSNTHYSASDDDDVDDDDDDDDDDDEEEEEEEEQYTREHMFWSLTDLDGPYFPKFESTKSHDLDAIILEFFEDVEIVYRYDE